MNSIGNKILETRKSKQLTQEELADLSKVNLRTIQRIENNINVPRGNTLKLICDALELNTADLLINSERKEVNNLGSKVVNILFLILLNLLLMVITGYLTLIQGATINSKVGGLLLSFFIPIYIVHLTSKMNPLERLLKFGTGYMTYIILIFAVMGFSKGFKSGYHSGLFLCLIVSIGVIYYGNYLINDNYQKTRKY